MLGAFPSVDCKFNHLFWPNGKKQHPATDLILPFVLLQDFAESEG